MVRVQSLKDVPQSKMAAYIAHGSQSRLMPAKAFVFELSEK